MRIFAATLVLSGLATSVAPAQDPVLKTATNVGVYTTRDGAERNPQYIPANAVLPLDTENTRTSDGDNARATTRIRCDRNGGFPELRFESRCETTWSGFIPYRRAAYTSDSSGSPWQNRPHAVTLQVFDQPGQRAQFTLNGSVVDRGLDTGGRARCDVGNDGSYELDITRGTRTQTILVTIPASGSVTVRVELFGYSRNGSTDDRDVTATCRVLYGHEPKTRVFVTPSGDACRGNLLIASDSTQPTSHQIVGTLIGAPPQTPGILLIGVQRVDVPLPLSFGCKLLVNGALSVPFSTHSDGTAVHVFPPVSKYRRFHLMLQDVYLTGANSLGASNGVDLDVKL